MDTPRGREHRVHAANEYVVWSAQFKVVADELQNDLVGEVLRYDGELRLLEDQFPEYGTEACMPGLASRH